jgi:hypothetical protein
LAALPSISPAGIAGRPDVDPGDLATLSLWWRQRLAPQPKPATNAKHSTKMATLVNGSVGAGISFRIQGKLALTEITAAIDQLFVRGKFACGPRRTGVA